MLAHNVNDYINQRRQHLQLKEKNLYTKNKHLMNEERTTYRPSSMYGAAPIEEKVYFDAIGKSNAIRANNNLSIYEANRKIQDGFSILDDEQDTRTTRQKMQDDQYKKDAVYKYAQDLIRDPKETAIFVETLYRDTSPKEYIVFFIRHFAAIKQNLGNVNLLQAKFLYDHVKEYYEKIRDTNMVDRPLTKTAFTAEMQQYIPPSQNQLNELHELLEKMKNIKPTETHDMLQRLDAIAALVDQIDFKQTTQINSDLPNRDMIRQLINMSKDIKDSIDAAQFLDMAKQLLQSVTSAETQRVLDMIGMSTEEMNQRMIQSNDKLSKKIAESADNINQRIDAQMKLYTAPTISLLKEIRNRVMNNKSFIEDTKTDLILKIDALETTVGNLQNTTFATSTDLPSAEDIVQLKDAGPEFEEQVTEVLSNVTPEAISQTIKESSGEMTEKKKVVAKKKIAQKPELTIPNLADYVEDDGSFNMSKLQQSHEKNNITLDDIKSLYQDYLKYSSENNEFQVSVIYKRLMPLLGFKSGATKVETMHARLRSGIVKARMRELEVDTSRETTTDLMPEVESDMTADI